jgi:hypothetical protein
MRNQDLATDQVNESMEPQPREDRLGVGKTVWVSSQHNRQFPYGTQVEVIGIPGERHRNIRDEAGREGRVGINDLTARRIIPGQDPTTATMREVALGGKG